MRAAWYPIVYGEESYEVTTPGEFWLEALFHVGERTEESRWQRAYQELRAERDETRLRERALAQLMDFADERKARLLLVVENLDTLIGAQISSDEAWTLRHTLMNEPRIMLLGSATSRFKEVEDYNQALYDLFKIIELEPLSDAESQSVWRSVTGDKPSLTQIRPIQILTGGNPRLIRIISGFAAKTSFRQLMANLLQLIDEHTEYFKSHLDGLAPRERKVFVALADLWDPSTARDVAEAARLDVNKTSALLKRLEQRGAVTVYDQRGRTKRYQVAERMYNIYHLMRRRGQASSRVQFVVRFMIHFYEGDELVRATASIAEEACALTPEQRREHFQVVEALLTMAPEAALKSRIVEETGHFIRGLPDAPSSLQQIMTSLQAQEPPAAGLAAGEVEASLKLRIDELEAAQRLMDLIAAGVQDPDRQEEVEAAFRRAIDRYPQSGGIWMTFAMFLLSGQREDEGRKACERVLELAPADGEEWFFRVNALTFLGRYEETVDVLDRAEERATPKAHHWNIKGHVLTLLDRNEDALEAHNRSLELEPDNSRFLWSFALTVVLSKGQNKLPEAEAHILRALEQEPSQALYQHTLATILGAQGKWTEALEYASRFVTDAKMIARFLDGVVTFFIGAGAAGYAAEALALIEASPSALSLEPLTVALRLYQGEPADVALEIQEVANDVVKRIKARQKAMQEALTASLHGP